METALDDVYAACDAAIAEVLDALPAGADVVALHSAWHDAEQRVAGAHARHGRGGHRRRSRRRFAQGGGRPEHGLAAQVPVPTSVRGEAARLLPARAALELTARLESPKLDWSRTRAFAVPSDVQGFVRLNLRGRERLGTRRSGRRGCRSGRAHRGPPLLPGRRRPAGGRLGRAGIRGRGRRRARGLAPRPRW